MDGLSLLNQAQAAGLTITARGHELLINGPKHAQPLALELIRHKAIVLNALWTEAGTTPLIRHDQL
jgi:hypothetical protein